VSRVTPEVEDEGGGRKHQKKVRREREEMLWYPYVQIIVVMLQVELLVVIRLWRMPFVISFGGRGRERERRGRKR
jgi:hypothetical protein